MSYYDYVASQKLAATDWPFYALIMAAMRKAGGANLEHLIAAYPDVWAEMGRRYIAPFGLLPGEVSDVNG